MLPDRGAFLHAAALNWLLRSRRAAEPQVPDPTTNLGCAVPYPAGAGGAAPTSVGPVIDKWGQAIAEPKLGPAQEGLESDDTHAVSPSRLTHSDSFSSDQ